MVDRLGEWYGGSNEENWNAVEEGETTIYRKGNFTIGSASSGPGVLWIGKHHSQEITRGNDLQAVMDYCDGLANRLD